MRKSLVSVVVPIYRVEKYLDRCIESIVNQTYTDLEIILVDDGSPDHCPEMCNDWAKKDARIKVVHKENAGLGMARNTGIEYATGEYIFFVDSDDYVDRTVVEKCVSTAKVNHAEVVVFGSYDEYDDGRLKKQQLSPTKVVFEKESVTNELLPSLFTYDMGFGVSAWGKMFDLELINRYGVRFKSEREIISEDAFFTIELFSKVSIAAILPENLYFYCKRGDSLTKVYNKDRQEKNDIFLQKSLDFARGVKYPEKVLRHIQVCYHGYTIAAMKLIVASTLSKKEKYEALKQIFKSPTLRQTLGKDILRIEKTTLKIFFSLVKIKCYYLCYLLLKYKINKKV